MLDIRIIGSLFLISLRLFLHPGCKPDEGEVPSSTSLPHFLREENKKATVEVTIGGKVWKIDPNLSYQATGVWTNPNPRLLTDAEKERFQVLPALIKKLEKQRDELDKELRYLERIEEPQVKTHYHFGKPPRFSPDGKTQIIDLGEFPIEMDIPAKIHSEQSELP